MWPPVPALLESHPMYPHFPVIQLHAIGTLVRIESYPAAHVIGLLVLVVMTLRLYARDVRPTATLLDPFLFGVPAAMLGASVLGSLTAGTWLPEHLSLAPSVLWTGHRSAYGGLLAGVAVAALVARLRRIDVLCFLDAGAPGLAFATCCARIGCFLGGCCYGLPTASVLGVRFPDGHPGMAKLLPGDPRGLHPTQLYLAAAALAIGLVLLALRRRQWGRPGHRFALGAALYAATTFAVELLRDDPGRWFALGLSHTQWISIAIVLATAVVLGRSPRFARRRTPAVAVGLLLVLATTPARAQSADDAFNAIAEGLVTRNPTASVLVAQLLELGGGGPLTTWARIAKGADGLLQGDLGGAIAQWQAAAAADPGTAWSAQADLALGLGYMMAGARGGAADALAAAAEHGEGDTVAYAEVSLGRLQAVAGDYAGAERSFRRVFEDYSAVGVADDAALGLAKSLVAQDRRAEAREVLAVAHGRYWHRGAYMVARRNRPLPFDQVGSLTPAQLGEALRARAAGAATRGVLPIYAVLAALTDHYSGPDLERLRHQIARAPGATSDRPAAAAVVQARAVEPGAASQASSRGHSTPRPLAAGHRQGFGRVAVALLALVATTVAWLRRARRGGQPGRGAVYR
jgi:phosphatidylglycerol:prolipoprotein diacylglycerol transferase